MKTIYLVCQADYVSEFDDEKAITEIDKVFCDLESAKQWALTRIVIPRYGDGNWDWRPTTVNPCISTANNVYCAYHTGYSDTYIFEMEVER